MGAGLYDDLPRFPFRPVAGKQRAPVVVLGAGPVGLALAAGLARQGVRCLVVEPRGAVSFGSRAICLSRRSLEILEGFGVAAPILAAGLPWTTGRSFWRGHQVLAFAMPHGPEQRHPPMLNLQQCFTEQLLVEALEGRPEVELRWHSRMLGLRQEADRVVLRVGTPEGEYDLEADWVVATDGARSPARAALGLELRGTSYEGRYLIADIRLRSATPTERRAWFDPPSNPGSTLLMHRQPGDVWRIDYQLREEEDAEAAQREDAVRARIDAHLAAIGEPSQYELLLISLYRAHCLTLDSYRQGRVLLAGDAAHLVPIFGVRGLNSGIEDAGNLAWKLAAVLRGEGGEALLDSYSEERVFAARENIRAARKSTLFMTPPSRGHALLRDAALSLSVHEDWARVLVNPRQSSATAFPDSPLSTPEAGEWAAGPRPGMVLPSIPLGAGHVQALVGPGPTILWAPGLAPPTGLRVVEIDESEARTALGLARPGAGYLMRPDGHVAWRWQDWNATGFATALRRMMRR
ncbi:FAD-dependent monooxygenase [Belnapia sp. T6]|uniref:FAD-dependent monooxygenase n=1 Tax=Belnapia mucosa TaxID=2804532 RepID=A0ABS1UZE3_9PROT|nr:FAD-dependent monooxygenase [Belnapia mucosa]MBL6454831.1 FAD-dependent monooxygenase [Belnapia mucosa]